MTPALRTRAAALLFITIGLAACSPVENALDPDCTAEKAARNAALQTTVGVGNRCGAGETVRDMTGTDGKIEDARGSLT